MRRLKTPRPAFTLTELLVVIALIIVLGALGIGAASKGVGWVKQRATETTMTKVIQRLQRRIDQIYKEAEDWPTGTETLLLLEAAGSPERAQVLKVLYLYKWSFPSTYAEAFHNVQESRILYDPAGYPPARAILGRLTKGYPAIPDPFAVNPAPPFTVFWAGGTPAVSDMPTAIPAQSAACMLAAYIGANGSPDDFSADELTVANSVAGDGNQMLVDAWGTPYLFLRHGNFIHSRHRVGGGGVDRAAHWMGMVNNTGLADLDFAPLEFVLNPNFIPNPSTWPAQTPLTPGPPWVPPSWPQIPRPPNGGGVTAYYFVQIQQRALTSFGVLTSVINGTTTGRDPFDPTAQLKNNIAWRTAQINSAVLPYDGWLDPTVTPWLAPLGAGSPPQNVTLFRRTFGYSPELSATIQNYQNQAYTPMLILSAGGDKQFFNWDDNLDSYRLQVNVSSQQ